MFSFASPWHSVQWSERLAQCAIERTMAQCAVERTMAQCAAERTMAPWHNVKWREPSTMAQCAVERMLDNKIHAVYINIMCNWEGCIILRTIFFKNVIHFS